jgi:hypothetical protein
MFVIALRHLLPFHPVRTSKEREKRKMTTTIVTSSAWTHLYIYMYMSTLSMIVKCSNVVVTEKNDVMLTARALSTLPNRSKTRSIVNGENKNRVGHFSLSRCNVTLQLISYGSPAMIVHAQLHFVHLNLNEEWGSLTVMDALQV